MDLQISELFVTNCYTQPVGDYKCVGSSCEYWLMNQTILIPRPHLRLYLAVLLEDISGGGEVQHPVDDQLTVAS